MERRQLRWLAVGFDKIDGDKAIARPEHPGLDLYDPVNSAGWQTTPIAFGLCPPKAPTCSQPLNASESGCRFEEAIL
jgi:hypothetical protein